MVYVMGTLSRHLGIQYTVCRFLKLVDLIVVILKQSLYREYTCITSFSLNIFIHFSEEHIQTQNRKFGTMNNITKMLVVSGQYSYTTVISHLTDRFIMYETHGLSVHKPYIKTPVILCVCHVFLILDILKM